MAQAQTETLFPRVLDNTMYSDWRSCPHRFFRRHCQGLSRGRKNVHLHFGGCFARATEVVRREWITHHDLSDAVKSGCEAFIDAWGTFELPDYATSSEQRKSLQAGLLAVQDYFTEWPLDEDPLQIYIHQGEPAIEFAFALPVPGTRHPDNPDEPLAYCGRFDMIGQEGKTIIGLDDKTSGSLGEHWRNQWRLRSQFTGYVWGAANFGVPIERFRIRGTSPLKGGTKFDQSDTPRAFWFVNRWLAQLTNDLNVMCTQYRDFITTGGEVEPHPFGRNLDHACSDFNGCEFLDLCASEVPDRWLTEYSVDRWNPLERPQG